MRSIEVRFHEDPDRDVVAFDFDPGKISDKKLKAAILATIKASLKKALNLKGIVVCHPYR